MSDQMDSLEDAALRRQSKREMADTIRLLLNTPMGMGPVTDIEDVESLQELADRNVTISTRILMKKAIAAMKGDDKAAQFLFEYGGLKPVEDKHVSVDLPVFIDDLTSMEMRPPALRKSETPMIDVTSDVVIEVPPEPIEVKAPVLSIESPKKEPASISRPTRTIHANPIIGVQVEKKSDKDGMSLPDWVDTI